MNTLDTKFGQGVDKKVGNFFKRGIIGGIRLAAGTCSLLYRTSAALAKATAKGIEYTIDTNQAIKDAKEYDRLVDAAGRLSQETGRTITPTMFLTEVKRQQIAKAYEESEDAYGTIEGMDLDAYLRPSNA